MWHTLALALVAGRKTHAAMVSRDTHRLFAILGERRRAQAAMAVEDTNRVM